MNENQVLIFDTTARDGKQAPGNNFDPQDTLRLAHQLEKLGVNIMEAGFPIAGPDDFEAVRLVAENIKGFTTCALARASKKDIDTAAKALENALVTPRIHTFIASSDIHIREKLNSDPNAIIEYAVTAVTHARKYTTDVEFSPEDASRTGFDFLKKIIEAVIDAGATTVNIPDTVGYALPNTFGETITRLIHEVPSITERGIVISTHCHNDLGLATANSLAGVVSGARQVECTINGIGERAGNTHMAEVVMVLNTHREAFGLSTSINTHEIGTTARLVASITNKPLGDTTPVVGQNVFAHSSGIHQHGTGKSRNTYEIMSSKSVGWEGEMFPLSAQSGRAGLSKRLSDIGYSLNDSDITTLYEKFIHIANEKPLVHNEDLYFLVQELTSSEYHTSPGWISIVNVEYHKMNGARSSIVHLSCDGVEFQASGSGDGPVDSAWSAVKTALSRQNLWIQDIVLTEFSLGKSTGGTDALGLAEIKVTCGDTSAHGRSADTDIVVASVKAIINALNHLRFAPIQT